MKLSVRLISLLLLICTAFSALLGCANNNENTNSTETSSVATAVAEEDTKEPDKFSNYTAADGFTFKVYTSTNVASTGMGNSNFMIEGEGEYGHGKVSDAVYDRNIKVSELLGCDFSYTQLNVGYGEVASEITTLHKAGDYEYDLIINDLFPLAGLSINGYFINTLSDEFENCFDFSQKYWYNDYMKDLTFTDGYSFILAGDYFADVIRSAHCLIYNKDMYIDIVNHDNGDEPYEYVLNYEWTQQKLFELTKDCYKDMDDDSKKSSGDRYGIIFCDMWGGSIPFITSGGCNYITRDEDGTPEITIYGDKNDNRTLDLVDSMFNIFYSDGASFSVFSDSELLPAFMSEKSLFVGYQRLGSLENLTERPFQIGILPYPMLRASDHHYTTSSHDTTEIGVIPQAAYQNISVISAILEVLNRETSNIIIPQYYGTSLKVRYADDETAAQMIDIIHDGFGNTFQLAYDYSLNTIVQSIIYQTVYNKSNTVASSAAKVVKNANRKLDKVIQDFEKNNKK